MKATVFFPKVWMDGAQGWPVDGHTMRSWADRRGYGIAYFNLKHRNIVLGRGKMQMKMDEPKMEIPPDLSLSHVFAAQMLSAKRHYEKVAIEQVKDFCRNYGKGK